MRVDLDSVLAHALVAQESARERGDNHNAGVGVERWTLSPRRDGAVDVVVESSGADVFDRALLVDAEFAVAAQPVVVAAMVERITALEATLRDAVDAISLRPAQRDRIRAVLDNGVVVP